MVGSCTPDEERKNDNTTQEVVYEEEDRINQSHVRLWLLPLSRDADSHSHNVYPSFQ